MDDNKLEAKTIPIGLTNAGKGRPKGVPNKVTKAVKEMILEALDNAGGVSYLVEQSEKNPQAFLTLVGKVLPLEVKADIVAKVTHEQWLESLS